MKRWIRIFIPTFIVCTALAEITIDSVFVEQQAGTKLMDISYNIICTNTTVDISLSVSNGTSAIVATNITGDVGESIPPGEEKKMTWDAGLDWPTNVADLVYTISAIAPELPPKPVAPAPVAQTGQTNSYQSGDDGDLQVGAAWPTPRFTNNDDGTVLDNLTGLEWVQSPHTLTGNAGFMNWSNAVSLCYSLSYAGHDDWHLPSRKELLSLIDYGQTLPAIPSDHPFSSLARSYYWSGTSNSTAPASAWRVYLNYGTIESCGKQVYSHAWPVRNTKKGNQ